MSAELPELTPDQVALSDQVSAESADLMAHVMLAMTLKRAGADSAADDVLRQVYDLLRSKSRAELFNLLVDLMPRLAQLLLNRRGADMKAAGL